MNTDFTMPSIDGKTGLTGSTGITEETVKGDKQEVQETETTEVEETQENEESTESSDDVQQETEQDDVNNEGDSSDAEAQAEETEESNFDISSLNKRFETSFENEEGFKEALSKLKDYESLKQMNESLKEKSDKYEKLKDKVDPRQYFANDKMFKLNAMIQKFPDKDPGVMSQLSSLNKDEINNMNSVDALKKSMLLEYPGTSESDAMAIIREKYNFEDGSDNISSLESVDQAKLRMDATQAKKTLNEVLNVELPEGKDLESMESQMQQEAEDRKSLIIERSTPIVNKLIQETKSISVDVDGEQFVFNLDESAKEGLAEAMIDQLVSNGLEPTRENIQALNDQMQRKLRADNLSKIMKAYSTELKAKTYDDTKAKYHNTKPRNEKEVNKETDVEKIARANSEVAREKLLGTKAGNWSF